MLHFSQVLKANLKAKMMNAYFQHLLYYNNRLFNVLCWLWCIFHDKHKTFYNLFSPDAADSCVADKQVSYREI